METTVERNGQADGKDGNNREVLTMPQRTKGRTVPSAIERPAKEGLPIEIDLTGQSPQRILYLNDRGGKRVALHPFITVAAIRRRGWYQARIAGVQAQMEACEDEGQFDELDRQYASLQDSLVRTLIPDLPEGLIDAQPAAVMMKFMEAMNAIVEEALGEAPPPEVARRDA